MTDNHSFIEKKKKLGNNQKKDMSAILVMLSYFYMHTCKVILPEEMIC